MPAVSNTSPISNLAWIGRLNLLLDQFHEIWIPTAVETELQNIPDAAAREAVAEAMRSGQLKSRAASDANLVSLLMVELHAGEAEAIALALELKADHLLIDEREGRSLAR
jgi:predicted nucleic acid-binding protein